MSLTIVTASFQFYIVALIENGLTYVSWAVAISILYSSINRKNGNKITVKATEFQFYIVALIACKTEISFSRNESFQFYIVALIVFLLKN